MARYNRINFQTAVISHFGEISSTSFMGEDINKVADHLYALLHPYLDIEIDKALWEDNVDTDDPYEYMMNKIRICMIVLYRMGMLPTVKYENRVFEEQITAKRAHLDDMAKQVAEEVYFKEILLMHVMSITKMYNLNMDYNLEIHIDLLWMYLSPYITFEDMENWEANYESHLGNPDKYDRYYFIEQKKRICMTVLDRAGFLWSRSTADADETKIEEGKYLEDITHRPELPPKTVDDGDDVYIDDNDYFEHSNNLETE